MHSPIPAAGEPAPEFVLPSQDGSAVSLKDFRGRWVVLYFYPKDNTPGCTLEARNFEKDLSKYKQFNAVVLGVSLDSTGSHLSFGTKHGLTFKLLSDAGKKVAPQYGSMRSILGFKVAARNTFLIDPDGKIAHVWTGVEAAGHSKEILALLAETKSLQD
jgi:thioredoxin-dependent peroxiredoxin